MPYSKRKKTGTLSTIVKTCHKYNIQDKVLSLLILNPNHISREQWGKNSKECNMVTIQKKLVYAVYAI